MFLKRTLVVLVLLPVGLTVIVWGGLAYACLVTLLLGLAALEYVNLFRAGGLQPAGFLVVGGTLLFMLGRALDGFVSAPWMLSLVVLAAMTYHALAYERGRDQAGTDFCVTLAGVFYLGWLGPYLISLRDLGEGLWWTLTVLPAVWLADSSAYMIGSLIGRHKMTSRLSPKKSWEGYLSGIVISTLGTALLAALWGNWTGPDSAVTPLRGALIGFILGTLTILGDLGVSMIKRQFGVKDTGGILPGHGGAFDRLDSWLWGAVIGYYLIVGLF